MLWLKAIRGTNSRVPALYKIERDMEPAVAAYARDQGVNKSDVINTLFHNHKPLMPYLRQQRKRRHNAKDNNSN